MDEVLTHGHQGKSVLPGGGVVTELVDDPGGQMRRAIAQLPAFECRAGLPHVAFGVDAAAYDDPGATRGDEASQLGTAIAQVPRLGAQDEAALLGGDGHEFWTHRDSMRPNRSISLASTDSLWITAGGVLCGQGVICGA